MKSPNALVKDRFVEAVFTRNAEVMRPLLDPDFTLHQNPVLPYGGTYRGVEGYFDFLDRFFDFYEIEHVENTETLESADGDLQILEFTFRARIRKTGQIFASTILEAWRYRQGRILDIKPHYYELPGAPT